MKLLITSFFILVCFTAQSQQKIPSELPVRNGFITSLDVPNFNLKENGLRIASTTDSCFATEDGKIKTVFRMQGEYAILFQTSPGQYITYSNLLTEVVDRGMEIKKGDFLGLLKKGKVDYNVVFMLTDSKGTPLSTKDHYNYFGLKAAK